MKEICYNGWPRRYQMDFVTDLFRMIGINLTPRTSICINSSSFFFLLLVTLFAGTSSLYADLLYDTLKGGVGVRPLSMGNAYTSLGEGGYTGYYNPAGFGLPGTMYGYETLDFNKAFNNSFFGHYIYLSPFGLSYLKREDKMGDSVEVWGIGFGRRGRTGLDWGIHYKSVREDYAGFDNHGWSADFGLLGHITSFLNVGLTAKDIMKDNLNIPTTVATGISVFMPQREFVLSYDLVSDEINGKTDWSSRLGMELLLTDGLIIRGGIDRTHYSGGVSFVMPGFELLWGVRAAKENSGDSQTMLGIRLGRGLNTYAAQRQYALFKPKQYAEFAIGGNLTQGQSEVSLFGGEKIGTNDLLRLIHYAAIDPSCEGFIIRIGSLSDSIATVAVIQEIRTELLAARKNGKKIVAYLEHWATLPEYFLATAADKIVMPELAALSHLGLDLEVQKTKAFLNTFGIDEQVITSGAHKGMLHPNSGELSDADRFVLEDLVHTLYNQILFEIKQARNLKWQDIGHLFDGRIVSASEAKELGLVDELGYRQKVKDVAGAMDSLPGKSPSITSINEFVALPSSPFLLPVPNRIAVIEIDGNITMGPNRQNILFGGKSTGADDIERLTESIGKDFTVRGVIIRVNSSGGSLIATDRIYEAIGRLKKSGKPVYTSMGNVAASGGYYVAMNSDKIIANPGTLTGSIGVISVFQNLEDLYEMLGITHEVIKTGKHVDMLENHRKLADEEVAMLRSFQDQHYRVFVNKVKAERHLTEEEALEVAQGQIFTGEQAVKLKLVDEVGSFYDAVEQVSEKAHIFGKPELVFYRMNQRGLFEQVTDQLVSYLTKFVL